MVPSPNTFSRAGLCDRSFLICSPAGWPFWPFWLELSPKTFLCGAWRSQAQRLWPRGPSPRRLGISSRRFCFQLRNLGSFVQDVFWLPHFVRLGAARGRGGLLSWARLHFLARDEQSVSWLLSRWEMFPCSIVSIVPLSCFVIRRESPRGHSRPLVFCHAPFRCPTSLGLAWLPG